MAFPSSSPFASESTWPFALRHDRLQEGVEFVRDESDHPRVLRISGPSGTGKSFLARELLVQASTDDKYGLGLYLDVPPGELEASALLAKIESALTEPTPVSRQDPSFVGTKVVRSWMAFANGTTTKKRSYGYGVFRELTGQIPLLGPFLKALMPRSAFDNRQRSDGVDALRFVVRRSRSRPVTLVLDNIQFLPFALRELLADELALSGNQMRLVLIERVRTAAAERWRPPMPDAEVLDIDLATVSEQEVAELVRAVLPRIEDADEISSAVHRRSEGNLKSVWFQLRLLATRRDDQDGLARTYEDVIQALPASDQAVLRSIVFTVGGLTITTLALLLEASKMGVQGDTVRDAVGDLAALGLLVVNGEKFDRVRVEHELVAHVVADITPEEDKLELRQSIVNGISALLDSGSSEVEEDVLQDRLLGVVNGAELRQSPSLLSHLVRFVRQQSRDERHGYLASICRDSACWDALDVLPETSVRALLDAIQKTSLFSFGLVATARLRQNGEMHGPLAALYEAKYLVQLFRYNEAREALARAADSPEKRVVGFNILLSLAVDEEAADVASEIYAELDLTAPDEFDLVVLRNSAHLFPPDDARVVLESALAGFERLGRRFGAATTVNNLGIIDLVEGQVDAATQRFREAHDALLALGSPEVYQPLMNLAGARFAAGDLAAADAFLKDARRTAPRSLQLDSAMLDLNELALSVRRSGAVSGEAGERARRMVELARRTHDLRFVDVAVWFASALDAHLGSVGENSDRSTRRVAAMRTSGRVAIELFAPVTTERGVIEVPFVLSPHWRY